MRYFFIKLFMLLLLSVIISCKKEEQDEEPPQLTVIAPVSGNSYNVFDTIHVQALMRDNKTLSFVSVSILNENFIPVMGGFEQQLNMKEYALNYDFVLNDERLESGSYYLSISTGDGIQKTHTEINITITASPKKVLGFYTVHANGASLTLVKNDSALNFLQSQAFAGHYNQSAFSSFEQIMYVAGGNYQPFRAIDRISNQTIWTLPNLGAGTNYWTALMCKSRHVYIGDFEGNISKLNRNATTIKYYYSGDPSYYPMALYTDEMVLIGGFKNNQNALAKLIAYQNQYGTSIQEKFISFTPEYLFKQNGSIYLVLGNDINQQAMLSIYDLGANSFYNPYTLSNGKLTSAVELSPQKTLFALDNGNWYCYDYIQNSLNLLITNEPSYGIKFDEVNQIVYAPQGLSLKTFNYAQGTLTYVSTKNFSDSIKAIEIIYNK